MANCRGGRYARPVVTLGLILVVALAGGGCAVRYLDPETGTEHLWGIGHLTIKVTRPSANVHAIVTGASTVGLAVGKVADERYLAVGLARQERAEVAQTDTTVCVERPTLGAAGMRIGSGWAAGEGLGRCE
jgi:hypothetical protein